MGQVSSITADAGNVRACEDRTGDFIPCASAYSWIDARYARGANGRHCRAIGPRRHADDRKALRALGAELRRRHDPRAFPNAWHHGWGSRHHNWTPKEVARMPRLHANMSFLALDKTPELLQPNGVMQRLADLARVPKTEEAREYFSRHIDRGVQGVWIDFELSARYPAWKNPGPRDAASEEIAARTRRFWRPP